jgi:hypothetical protein
VAGTRIGKRIKSRRRDVILFLTALLLALLTWFVTNLSKEYPGIISIPVVAECNIDGHSNVSSNVVMVSARCRASGFRLVSASRAEKGNPVKVSFDRSHLYHAGGDVWYICGTAKNSYVDRFFGKETTVEGFITDTLEFTFPAENSKKVPVNLVQSITFSPQYMAVSPVKISPDSVIVYGEVARLEGITEVNTVPLELLQVDKDRHGVVRLNQVRGVRTSVQEVNYSLEVARFVELQTRLNMEMRGAPEGARFSVYPSTAMVYVRCSFPLGSKDPSEHMDLYIDYNDFKNSINGRCVPRSGHLPAGVISYRVEPEVFECFEVEGE